MFTVKVNCYLKTITQNMQEQKEKSVNKGKTSTEVFQLNC